MPDYVPTHQQMIACKAEAAAPRHFKEWDTNGRAIQELCVKHEGCNCFVYFGKVGGVWVNLWQFGNRLP